MSTKLLTTVLMIARLVPLKGLRGVMRLSTGSWVSGDDFFDREHELSLLQEKIRDHNHILLTGQRRMGKTSLAQEIGRRLEADGWNFLFANIEGANREEDVVAEIARSVYGNQGILARFGRSAKRWIKENIDEVSAYELRVKVRATLNSTNWQQRGADLFHACAEDAQPVLLVIDELPIFLKRLLRQSEGLSRCDLFLSWLRGVSQELGTDSPVLLVSGSIGLEPLVRRLGIPDRINHFYSFRLNPWDRNASVACFERLAKHYGLAIEDGVAEAVYDTLGIGIPYQLQAFFARIRDFSAMQERDRVVVKDVREVYRHALLGPSGHSDLMHYETRLNEALEEHDHAIAMEILAEAAVQGAFSLDAKLCLTKLYEVVADDAAGRIANVLELLIHDGYLETDNRSHCIPSHLLRDWLSARFQDHHVSLRSRCPDARQLGERP